MPFNDPKNQLSILSWALAILFATFGAVVKYVSVAQEKDEKITWIKAGIQGFIGGFSGLVSTLYMLENDYGIYMIWLGACLSGFLGVIALRAFSKLVFKISGGANE